MVMVQNCYQVTTHCITFNIDGDGAELLSGNYSLYHLHIDGDGAELLSGKDTVPCMYCHAPSNSEYMRGLATFGGRLTGAYGQ